MPFTSSRVAAVTAALLVGTALAATPAGAQDLPATFCLGLTAETAEAQGYRVQLGTDGVDVLTGGNVTRDFILGFGGDDLITGAGADDVICGGEGNDIINAGDGNDRVAGGPGSDDITLGSGDDRARAGWGADRVVGGSGDDYIQGNGGNDRISGETGNDTLLGNLHADVIFGGEGNDLIRGLRGHDRLAGGPGNDRIESGIGDDIASGDDGDDLIFGGPGFDTLDGDADDNRLNGGDGDLDRCDTSTGDEHLNCEFDLGGAVIDPADASEPVVVSNEPEPAPESTGSDIAPPAGAPVPASQAPQGTNQFGWPLLTDAGLEALLQCESGGRHDINTGNGFYGGVQWLPATWNAATVRAGFPQYDGVLPHLVPADVQDEVTKVWWEATRPNTQWPTCHVRSLAAMNVLAP